jgi:hypothetical protein
MILDAFMRTGDKPEQCRALTGARKQTAGSFALAILILIIALAAVMSPLVF